MEKLLIYGPTKLQGKVKISGAKNAILPILAACILVKHPIRINNIPYLRDVSTMIELLSYLGVECTLHDKNSITINAAAKLDTYAPYDLVRRMRASVLVLGPLLAREGAAKVSLPGGCAIGARPVDLHIDAMRQLQAEVEVKQGYIKAVAPQGRLQGGRLKFSTVTVTGTENAMMAAVLADGITILDQVAIEPEVTDLANFLQAMGAKIEGIGTSCMKITGVKELKPLQTHYSIMFDRIEAGTFLLAGAITAGDVEVMGVVPEQLQPLLDKLQQTGGELTQSKNSVRLNMKGRLPKAVSVETAPYPGYATDLQAQLVAMNSIGEGAAEVKETVFESRFMHVQELMRLGADITLGNNTVYTKGNAKLCGAPVMATDLRASASLILAGMAAKGMTTINRIYHVDRGYEMLEEKFNALGANIERVHG